MATKKKTTTAATPAPVVQKTAVDFASEYGVQAALVNSDPGLKSIFDQAVAEKWTAAKFQAAFQNSDWYKTHSDNWRVAESARLTDPASWAEQTKIAADSVRKQANALGFELSDVEVSNLANQALYLSGGTSANINLDTLKTHVVETGRITGKGGTSLQLIDSLKKSAYDNGVSYSDAWYEAAAKDTLLGKGTIDSWTGQVKDAAKSKYAALAPQIDAGMSVRDIASPYLQQMANTFELDQNALTLDDPLMQKALTNLDESNKPMVKPLWQFQQELKQDDRYFKTNKANQEFTSLATTIARQFGKTV